jgi:hypothetical protein
MPTDNQEAKSSIVTRFQNLSTFKKIKEGKEKKQQQIRSIMDSYDNIKDKSNNLIPYLLDLIQIGGGKDAVKRVRKKITNGIGKMNPEIKEIIFEELLNFLNCNLDFELPAADGPALGFANANDIVLDIRGVDIMELLKIVPGGVPGKFLYEKEAMAVGSVPFAMNKQLYDVTANPSGTFTIFGASTNPLFDIVYDGTTLLTIRPYGRDGSFSTGPTTPANPTPWRGAPGENNYKLTEFIRDYFDSIDMFGKTNFMAMLFEILEGVVSIQLNKTPLDLELDGKFWEIIKRILGLCGDDDVGLGNEINVSGTGHLSDDDVDTNLFEFGPQDLRHIYDLANLRMKGMIRFEDCDNIEKPVDVESINSALDSLLGETDPTVENIKIEQALNNNINGFGINIPNLDLNINLDIIKQLPQILISLILTPKIILPIVTAWVAIGNTMNATNKEEFLKEFIRLVKRIIKRLKDLLIQILYDEVKKFILQLIDYLTSQIIGEQTMKQMQIIQSLISLLTTILEMIDNLMNCKSILDSIMRLLKIPLPPGGGLNVPSTLRFATSARPGYSKTRAVLNTLENLEESGIDVSDNPDGSPNEYVTALMAYEDGRTKEFDTNAVTKVGVYPMTVKTPGGIGTTDKGQGTGLTA